MTALHDLRTEVYLDIDIFPAANDDSGCDDFFNCELRDFCAHLVCLILAPGRRMLILISDFSLIQVQKCASDI